MTSLTAQTEDDGFEWDVFISYNRDVSHGLASLLYAALQQGGIPTWWDRRDIHKGDDFFAHIVHGVERSRCMVALITPESLASRWCTGELFLGHGFQCVIPVLCGDSKLGDLPFGISGRDGFESFVVDRDLQQLLNGVTNFKKKRPKRMGLLGVPFPTAHGQTLSLLEAINAWPPRRMSAFEAASQFRRAERMLSESDQEAVRQGVVTMNDPRRVRDGLLSTWRALESGHSSAAQWRAFAMVAQPFIPQLTAHALQRAKASTAEFVALLGAGQEAVKRELSVTAEQEVAAAQFVAAHRNLLAQVAPKESEKVTRSLSPSRPTQTLRPGLPPRLSPATSPNKGSKPVNEPQRARPGTEFIKRLVFSLVVLGVAWIVWEANFRAVPTWPSVPISGSSP